MNVKAFTNFRKFQWALMGAICDLFIFFTRILRGSLANGRWKAEIAVSEMTDMMQSGANAMVWWLPYLPQYVVDGNL